MGMQSGAGEVTALLERVRAGDKQAENRLFEIVMPQLRRLAQSLLNRERPDHTLQGTELVNEVYLRLAGAKLSLRDRAHFFAVTARAMRRELIDYARSRPKVDVLPLEGLPEGLTSFSERRDLALAIDELLDRMRETMPLECSIVELKFFFGMTDEETAEVLDLPLRSMQSKWHDARIWLFERAEAQQWKPSHPQSRPAATT
ncbi:MAG: RNA polymerase subunit sigma-70 [Bryobacterales bacterium]|nr:RNA polymerase subunit sigma-70 [Bryobacterales bacterium]